MYLLTGKHDCGCCVVVVLTCLCSLQCDFSNMYVCLYCVYTVWLYRTDCMYVISHLYECSKIVRIYCTYVHTHVHTNIRTYVVCFCIIFVYVCLDVRIYEVRLYVH